MNLSPAWIGRLAQHGIEAVHWSTIGASTAIDEEILSWARAHGFVLLTHDLDFSAILAATGDDAPSVIQLRTQDVLSDKSVDAIVVAVNEFTAEIEQGALLSIDESRTRVRILPLRRP